METLEFFGRVLAHQGFYCLVEFVGGKPRQSFYDGARELALAALGADGQGKTVYHACSTFKTKENRTAANAGWMRSFWVDADVDPGNPAKYASTKEAIVDLARAADLLQVPLPLIVRSGVGVHAYWILDDDLDAARWSGCALRLKAALEHLGFRQDRTRTADASSVLRPVGTHWRKAGVREVQALSPGVAVSPGRFLSAVESYCTRHDVQHLDRPHAGMVDAGESDLSASLEYPPSYASRIISHCATLAHAADRRGDVGEPLWRAMLGVVKYTVEGNDLCHTWSQGHPAYKEDETQDKIDRWTHGPTTCSHFRGVDDNRCAGCPHQVTSPIALGYSQEGAAPTQEPPVEKRPGGVLESAPAAEIPHWPKRSFHWNGFSICRAQKDDSGLISWLPFCDTLFYPTRRVRDEDGTWKLLVRYHKRNKQTGEFELETKLLGEPNKLHAALASYEIVMTGGNGQKHGAEFLREYMLGLQQANLETITYSKCGWADDFKSFIIGSRRVTLTTEDDVLTGEQVRSAGWGKDLGCSGTQTRWSELINELYARAGAEPYQFILGVAFAAPLVELTAADNWHGIPVAVTGPSGIGKSTTCRLACSIYGKGEYFLRAANQAGSTYNAMVSRIGVLRNLPMVFDEITNRDTKEVCDFLYALSNGRPKDRNRADGTIIDLGLAWNTPSFVTSNRNITELLFGMADLNVAEAAQVRVFEIPLSADATKGWTNVDVVDLIEHQLAEEYGVVGRAWLRYVMENKGALREEVRALRSKINPNDSEETKERYFRDLIVGVVVALKHVKKLGWVNFDVKSLAAWAQEHVKSLRRNRREGKVTPTDLVASFLMSLHGRTLQTQYFRDGRGTNETPMELLRHAPAARMAIEDKRFIVTVKAMHDWCGEHHVQPSVLLEELDRQEYLIHRGEERKTGSRRERLTKGTNIPGSPTYVYELEYAKVFGLMGWSAKDNVVPIAPRETTSGTAEGAEAR